MFYETGKRVKMEEVNYHRTQNNVSQWNYVSLDQVL